MNFFINISLRPIFCNHFEYAPMMMPPYPTYPSGWYSHPNHFPPNSANYSQKGLKFESLIPSTSNFRKNI